MGVKQTGRYCPVCERQVMATGTTPNHLLHFFLSLFTAGLWLPVWIWSRSARSVVIVAPSAAAACNTNPC